MDGSYDLSIVALSVAVAIIASYTALDMAGRVSINDSSPSKSWIWLVAGAVSMGTGIWSMHFIGMLSFQLPIQVAFDLPITLMSLIIAIAASVIALFFLRQTQLKIRDLIISTILMGTGIVAMHYAGMFAMQMSPPIRYEPLLFAASVLIAIVASFAALWISFQLRWKHSRLEILAKLGSAGVMGLAIAGMHYTGMAAARFAPGSVCLAVTSGGINSTTLAIGVGSVSLGIMSLTLIVSALDANFGKRSASANRQLRESDEKLVTILATIDNVIWSVDADTYETLYVNPAAERIYGRPASAFYADPKLFMNIVHPEDRSRVAQMLPELIEKGSMTSQYRIVRPDGEVRWLEDKTVIAHDADGRPVRFDGVASDITERKAHEANVLYLATHDALTDLPNRNLLGDRLTQDMAQAQRGRHTVSVLVLGLDRFKLINDSYGHGFGDALLRGLATRLRSSVRAGDTVARLRGDEFAVLFSPPNKPEETIPYVRRVLDIFSHPFVIHHIEQYVTASAGIAVFPADGRDPEILLQNAGAAMNWAKSRGRNDFQFFAPEMNAHATARLELENALKQALERTEFEVHYQPQTHVKTSQVVAVEALVRWRHPTQGLMPPGQFIGVAEETGLIVPIGAWVLKAACAQNKAWQDAGLPHLRMGVNVSAKQFWGGRIVDAVRRVLKETDLPPSDLELEITESVFLGDIEETVRTLFELKSMGVAISLDDFGTGYSSLTYLRRLPIDQLKIDGSFIRDLSADPNAAVLLSQIIQLGHAMHLEVVAEGVETENEYAFLADNHCDLVQGYYLHKQLSSTELGQLLKDSGARTRADEVARAMRA